jgi:hypothetical protein
MLLREWFKAQRRRIPQENHVHGYQYAAGCLLAGAKVETIEALCGSDDEFDAGMLHAINDWARVIQRLRVAAMMPTPGLIPRSDARREVTIRQEVHGARAMMTTLRRYESH